MQVREARSDFFIKKAIYKGTYKYSGVEVEGQHQTILSCYKQVPTAMKVPEFNT